VTDRGPERFADESGKGSIRRNIERHPFMTIVFVREHDARCPDDLSQEDRPLLRTTRCLDERQLQSRLLEKFSRGAPLDRFAGQTGACGRAPGPVAFVRRTVVLPMEQQVLDSFL
jgi:hypothetical protein